MEEYMKKKQLEKMLDEYIQQFLQEGLKRLEQDLTKQVAKEVPKIIAKEIGIKDSLKVLDGNGVKEHKYQQVNDVKSQHPEVKQQREKLQLGRDENKEKQGESYTFERVEKGKLVYEHGTGKARQEMHLSHRQLPLSAETRGKMVFYEFMQQMKTKDLKKMVKNSFHVAERDGRSANQVMYQMMHQKLDAFQAKLRNHLVQTTDLLQNKMTSFVSAVKDMDQVLAGQMLKLKELPEKVRNHPQYVKVRDALVAKRESGHKTISGYQGMQIELTNQLKLDLHAQYPELKLEQLTPSEISSLSRCAAGVNKGGVDELRKFISQSDDKTASKALSRAEGHKHDQSKDRTQGIDDKPERQTNEIGKSFNNR